MLVAALLVLIISAGVATALVSATDFTSSERRSSQGNAVAQQDQERMKAMSDSQLTSLRQTRTVTLNNTQFKVVSTASFIDANGVSSCVSGAEAYFKITSTVTSVATANNPGQTVTAESVITRPLAGTLVVPVQNEMSSPLNGAAVTVDGQNTGYTASATTDQNGCVAFAGLPTDGYTVTATAAGYVDPDGNPSATETASVNQTSLTSANTLILGSAGQIQVAFETKGTSVTYDTAHGNAPAGYALSYYGAGNGNNMTSFACLVNPGADCTGSGTPTTFNASTGVASFTVGSLFPFYINSTTRYTNNYQLWAGSCEQEQPLVPLTGSGFASVTPGKVALSGGDAVVDEPAIDVAVKYNGGTPSPAELRDHHVQRHERVGHRELRGHVASSSRPSTTRPSQAPTTASFRRRSPAPRQRGAGPVASNSRPPGNGPGLRLLQRLPRHLRRPHRRQLERSHAGAGLVRQAGGASGACP